MTNKEIKQAREDLCNILKPYTNEVQQYDQMEEWLNKYDVYVSRRRDESGVVWWEMAVENAHRFLQTEMMFNACISAKQSCIWAAVAATAALIAATAAWVTVWLMLKSA